MVFQLQQQRGRDMPESRVVGSLPISLRINKDYPSKKDEQYRESND